MRTAGGIFLSFAYNPSARTRFLSSYPEQFRADCTGEANVWRELLFGSWYVECTGYSVDPSEGSGAISNSRASSVLLTTLSPITHGRTVLIRCYGEAGQVAGSANATIGSIKMPWEAGIFVLLEGESCTIEFNWQGKYEGTQYAMARPLLEVALFPGAPGAIYGERTVNTSSIELTGRGTPEREPDWIYRVTVQNRRTDYPVFFTLTGGAV
jgi:hypothetical protein